MYLSELNKRYSSFGSEVREEEPHKKVVKFSMGSHESDPNSHHACISKFPTKFRVKINQEEEKR